MRLYTIATVVVLVAGGAFCGLSFCNTPPSGSGHARSGSAAAVSNDDVAAFHLDLSRRMRAEGLAAEADLHDRIASLLKGGRTVDTLDLSADDDGGADAAENPHLEPVP